MHSFSSDNFIDLLLPRVLCILYSFVELVNYIRFGKNWRWIEWNWLDRMQNVEWWQPLLTFLPDEMFSITWFKQRIAKNISLRFCVKKTLIGFLRSAELLYQIDQGYSKISEHHIHCPLLAFSYYVRHDLRKSICWYNNHWL